MNTVKGDVIMKPELPSESQKIQIEKKKHDINPGKDEDVVIKMAGYRIYFQNYYTIISLINDILTGVLYLAGSLVQTFTDLDTLGMYLYIFASFFLLMRPVLRIAQYVYLYNKDEYEEDVLGEAEENFDPGEELKSESDKTKTRKKSSQTTEYENDDFDTSKEKKE